MEADYLRTDEEFLQMEMRTTSQASHPQIEVAHLKQSLLNVARIWTKHPR